MNSTKRYLPMLAVVCVLFLTATLNAQNTTQAFTSYLSGNSPCDSSWIEVQGPTKIDYHVNSTDDAPHVTLHMQIEANSPDGSTNPYRANLDANGQFDSVTTSGYYEVPFHSVWIGKAAATNFKLDGTVRVFLGDDGTLNGSMIVAMDPAVCTN